MLHYIEKVDYMFKFDISQGYHHIDIFPDHQTFLGFSWSTKGVLRYFVFTVLPFGLTSGPFIFTKVVRVFVKFWRENGHKMSVYLDDGLGCERESPVDQ